MSSDCTLFNTVLATAIYGIPQVPSLDCCTQPGLSCNQNQRIVSIILGKNGNIKGSIPKEVASLSELSTFKLFQTNINGEIPSSLGSLSQLSELVLSGNQLTGSIPPELGNLTNLATLALDTNQLTGTIPKTLSNLKKLTMLHLSQNNLSGPIPLTVAQLPALTDLVFDSRNAPPQGALDPNRNSSSTAPQTFDVSPNNWLSILTLTGFGLILFVSVGLAITRIQKKNRKKKLKDSTLPTVLNTSSEKIDTMYPPRRVHQPIEIHRGLSLKSSGEVVRANTMISGVSAFSFQSNASAIPYRYNSLKSNNAAKISTIPRLNQSSGSLPETLNKIDEGERNDNPASPTNESFTSNLDDIQILAEQQQSRMATPGGMLKNNYPDRLFYFADKSGTDPFIDLINFLFFPVYVNLKAERAYQPQYDDEMKIQENDIILVLEHNYDGWCLGLNATTGLRGQFPLACTAPPHSTCVVLIYFQGLNDDFINHPLVQALLLSYPFAIRIKTLGLNPLTYFDCQDIFGHMKADNQKCFICGPRYFSQNISQLVNHYNTQENWNITTVETIDPDSTII